MSVESEGEGLNLVGKIKLDTSQLDEAVGKVQAKLTALNDGFLAAGKGVGLAALTQQALSLTAALAPALNLLLTLPAVVTTAGLALGTTALATHGLGKAFEDMNDPKKIKQFNHDLAELSPNARAFVKEAQSLEGELSKLQKLTQNDFFAGLDKSTAQLVKSSLPTLTVGFGEVATALNLVVKSAESAAASSFFQGKLAATFQETAIVTDDFAKAIGPLLSLFINLAAAAAPVIERFANWGTTLIESKAAVLDTAAGTQKLTDAMNKGGDVFSQIVTTLGNVAKGLRNIVEAAANPAMLSNINGIAAGFERWSASAKGQQQLAIIFGELQQISTDMAHIVPIVAKAFVDLATTVNALPGPLKDGVLEVGALLLLFPALTTVMAGAVGVVGSFTAGMLALTATDAAALAGLSIIAAAFAGLAVVAVNAKNKADGFIATLGNAKSVNLSDLTSQMIQLQEKSQQVQEAGATTVLGWIREQATLNELSSAYQKVSDNQQKLVDIYTRVSDVTGLNTQQVEALAKAQNIDLSQSTDKLTGQLVGAQFDLENNAGAVNKLWQEQQTLASKTSTTTEKMNAFKDALNNALGVTLDSQQGALQLADDVATLGEKYKEAGGKADLNTQSGRNLESALIDVTKQIQNQADALASSGGIQDTAAAKQAFMLQQLRGLQQAYPALSPLIQGYIDKINSVPTGVTTTLTAQTDAAKARLDQLRQELIDLSDPHKWTVSINPVGGSPVFVPNLDSGLAHHASGGFATGSFIAGEDGPEIINIGGAHGQVFNATDTKRMLGGAGAGVEIGQIILNGVTDAAGVRSALPDLIDAIRSGVGSRSGS